MNYSMMKTKEDRVLAALMSGRSFNRFEAETKLHDHCLHSTVSTIEKKHHINISRQFETVLGYMSNPTRVCRYWISPEERQLFEAKKLRSVNFTKEQPQNILKNEV